MTDSFKVLKEYKNDLVRAEVAAWLHNWDKMIDKKIASDWKKSKIVCIQKIDEWLNRNLDLKEFDNHLASIEIGFSSIDDKKVSLKELTEHGRKVGLDHSIWFVNYLSRCHSAAHIEKELKDKEELNPSVDYISSPFGFEQFKPDKISELLKDFRIPDNVAENRNKIQSELQDIFNKAWGDTRLPLNEVTLWDWAHIVAALYKAALAGALLQHQKTKELPDPKSLKWRLLTLRFDGSRVVDRSPNIQALLARREWIKKGLDKAKYLLEEEYPLATEVYRDDNGSLFVVPDIKDLLEYTTGDGNTLQSLIQEKLDEVFEGELIIAPQLDGVSWWGQGPRRGNQDEIPPIAKWLCKNESANPNPVKVKEWWRNSDVEPCRISGVRPQGPHPKAINRKLSDFWLSRIGERSKKWIENDIKSTIWIDEVAYINGRVALVAAKLDIKHWLTPEGLVNTLLSTQPKQKGDDSTKKNPSFARLRRIWETCAEFWQEFAEARLEEFVGITGPRLVIEGDLRTSEKLGPFHAYEINLKPGVDMEVVWHEAEKRLIVITNLQYLAKRLGAESAEYNTPQLAAKWLMQNHLTDEKQLKIYEPSIHGGKLKLAGDIRDIKVKAEQHDYLPAITILLEPQQFMVLVPADRALAVARHIKSEYEAQFSKVKNRLPLHLNLLFFNRKQPLYAALDAARRMLQRDSQVNTAWKVKAAGQAEEAKNGYNSNGRLGQRVISLNLERKSGNDSLPQLNTQLETMVSYSMGAPNTEDVWYPYLYVQKAVPDAPLDERQLCFKAVLPGCDAEVDLVHVKEVKDGDEVCYAPSTFDFEFLDVTARRFELVYDEATGMRIPKAQESYSTRPFLLEDLGVIQELWSIAVKNVPTRLKKAQLQQITGLIEAKRKDWWVSRPDDEVLKEFAEQVLLRSFGKRWHKIPQSQRVRLTSCLTSGRWRDLMELYASILKQEECENSINNEGEGTK